jgi:hypothetical protein
MPKIIDISYLDAAGDWEYAVVSLDDGTFGAAWIGKEPLQGDDDELVCPVDDAGDKTGVTIFTTKDAAEKHAAYIRDEAGMPGSGVI